MGFPTKSYKIPQIPTNFYGDFMVINYEVSLYLQGHLEATMASETTKMGMATRGNMHTDTRVMEVSDFNSEVKFEL